MIFLEFLFDAAVLYFGSDFFQSWFPALFCLLFIGWMPVLIRKFFLWG